MKLFLSLLQHEYLESKKNIIYRNETIYRNK
jgi:hypothetical protein